MAKITKTDEIKDWVDVSAILSGMIDLSVNSSRAQKSFLSMATQMKQLATQQRAPSGRAWMMGGPKDCQWMNLRFGVTTFSTLEPPSSPLDLILAGDDPANTTIRKGDYEMAGTFEDEEGSYNVFVWKGWK